MPITVSAPGKLMLMGEHAVVYGYPCIVLSINRYLTVNVRFSETGEDMLATLQVKDNSFVKETISIFRSIYRVKESVYIETKSELGNYGLGSSSAVTVAILKALTELFKIDIDKKTLFEIAYKTVSNVQGLGSGYDVASSIYGGVLYYSELGKVIEPLSADNIPLVVGYSGAKADTVSMVNLVKEKRESFKQGVEKIFENIAKLVDEAKQAIIERDWARVGKLMDYNQDYLEDLGVSTERLNAMILAARRAGAYGAKLSGAGGGDCMIALVSQETEEKVKSAIEKVGGEIL